LRSAAVSHRLLQQELRLLVVNPLFAPFLRQAPHLEMATSTCRQYEPFLLCILDSLDLVSVLHWNLKQCPPLLIHRSHHKEALLCAFEVAISQVGQPSELSHGVASVTCGLEFNAFDNSGLFFTFADDLHKEQVRVLHS